MTHQHGFGAVHAGGWGRNWGREGRLRGWNQLIHFFAMVTRLKTVNLLATPI